MQRVHQQWLHRFIVPLSSVALITIFFLTNTTIAAPTATPPGDNPAYPVNNSSVGQTKTGPLTVNGAVSATTISSSTLNVTTLCLSGGCRSSWPSYSYNTPTLSNILSSSYSSSYPIHILPNGGGIDWNGSGYRDRWYSARIISGSSTYRQLNYLTQTVCQSNESVCGIASSGGPYAPVPGFYCCQITSQMYRP